MEAFIDELGDLEKVTIPQSTELMYLAKLGEILPLDAEYTSHKDQSCRLRPEFFMNYTSPISADGFVNFIDVITDD